jgi:pyruvate dehydrogenase E1 component alpha subunit
MADPAKYRDQAEVDFWLARDPLKSFPKLLLDREIATQQEIEAAQESAVAEVQAAVQFSLDSPRPGKDELFTDIYA